MDDEWIGCGCTLLKKLLIRLGGKSLKKEADSR